ncbi:MAG: hypothetical protein ACLGPM_02610 [Acidobacteriota bacterium]
MTISIVTTTINVPSALRDYAANFRFFGHKDVNFIVIGDRKSHPATRDFCTNLNEIYPCTFLDIPAQERYLERFPRLWKHLRFDSIQRRNIGLLFAYENGAEAIITIDDDNFVLGQDFVTLHSCVGSACELPTYASTSGFFNVCSFLKEADDASFYHRGFPQAQRWNKTNTFVSTHKTARRVAINAGFWLDNPDIDALTRMERPRIVLGYKPEWPGNFALQPGTWSPFNSQNTALMREVVPAYFLSPYVGRYDDIWPSYIINRIAQHVGDVISFGNPLVRQERNPHDLWKDLDAERDGMMMTDSLCAALRSIELSRRTYHECLGEIITGLANSWPEEAGWAESQKECRKRFLEGLSIWHETFDTIGAKAES